MKETVTIERVAKQWVTIQKKQTVKNKEPTVSSENELQSHAKIFQ